MKVSPGLKKWLLPLLATSAAGATISMAVACGPVDEFIDYNAYLTRLLQGITIANFNSTLHDDVEWKGLPVADELIASYEYLSGDYPTRESCDTAPNNLWSALLPRTLNYEPSKRYVWARARTRQNFDTPVYRLLSNISPNLNLAQIKTHVDAAPNFDTINLNRIVISGTVDVIEIDESKVVLPQGVVIKYNVQNQNDPNAGVWRSASNFKYYLSLNRNIFNELQYFKTIVARLETSSENFVITDDKRTSGQPNVTGVKINTILSANNIDRILQGIKVAPAPAAVSYHNEVVWNIPNGPTLTPAVRSYEYLTGAAYSTLDAVKAAPQAEWKAKLPTEIEYDHNKRYLWVKVSLNSGYGDPTDPDSETQYYSITATSLIANVLTKVDALPGFGELDLSRVLITGRLSNLYVDFSKISTDARLVTKLSSASIEEAKAGNAPSGVYLAYQFNTLEGVPSGWYTWEKFKSSVSTRSKSLTTLEDVLIFKNSFRVRVQTIDSSKFVVINAHLASPNVVNTYANTITGPSELFEDIYNIRVVDGSSSNSINWINPLINSTINSNYVAKVQYFSGYYPDLISVQRISVLTQPSDETAAKLPISVSPKASERYLWVRIFPVPGQEIQRGGFFDITDSSGIRTLI